MVKKANKLISKEVIRKRGRQYSSNCEIGKLLNMRQQILENKQVGKYKIVEVERWLVD